MIGQALPKVSDFLKQMLAEESVEGRKGRRMEWLQKLQAVDDVDLLAWLGLSTCMDAVGSESSYT